MGTDLFEKSGLIVKRTYQGEGRGTMYAFDARDAHLTADDLLDLVVVLEKELGL
jgi:hypothetical protein